MSSLACPYCGKTFRGRDQLRTHIAENVGGHVPSDVAVAYAGDEANIGEDRFRQRVETFARDNGWLVSHVERGRGRDGRWMTLCAPGFPDSLFLHRSTGRIVVAEFKARKGRLAPEQQEWLDAFDRNPAARVVVWRPADWPKIQRVLAPRLDMR